MMFKLSVGMTKALQKATYERTDYCGYPAIAYKDGKYYVDVNVGHDTHEVKISKAEAAYMVKTYNLLTAAESDALPSSAGLPI